MSVTTFNQVDSVAGLVQDFWSPVFMKELREQTLWAGLLADPDYTFEKIKGGDTFKISRINKPTSTIRTIGTDADSFDTNVISTTQVDLQVNKRCVSAYEFEDMGIVLSQLEAQDSEMRAALLADVKEQANDYIKSLISPSSSSPDHVQTTSDFNLAVLSSVRKIAATAKWASFGEPWYLLVDPSYMSDMLDDTTLGAADTMGIDKSPMLEGKFVFKRMGFNIVEDDSLSTDTGFAFIPSFMKVILGMPEFKISPLHSQKKFGYIMSVDFPMGAVQTDDERVISMAVS